MSGTSSSGSHGGFAHVLAGLLAGLPGHLRTEAERLNDALGRAAREAQAFFEHRRHTRNCLLKADEVKDLTDRICLQLANLDAESRLQQTSLRAQAKHDALALQISVYALSGMREQLEKSLADFDLLLECAREQEARASGALDQGRTSSIHPVHPVHPQTRVIADGQDPPKPRGFMNLVPFRFVPRWRRVNQNERLAQGLLRTFAQFSTATESIQKAFRTASAQTLDELAVPMDELRATTIWLYEEESSFYFPRQMAV